MIIQLLFVLIFSIFIQTGTCVITPHLRGQSLIQLEQSIDDHKKQNISNQNEDSSQQKVANTDNVSKEKEKEKKKVTVWKKRYHLKRIQIVNEEEKQPKVKSKKRKVHRKIRKCRKIIKD